MSSPRLYIPVHAGTRLKLYICLKLRLGLMHVDNNVAIIYSSAVIYSTIINQLMYMVLLLICMYACACWLSLAPVATDGYTSTIATGIV